MNWLTFNPLLLSLLAFSKPTLQSCLPKESYNGFRGSRRDLGFYTALSQRRPPYLAGVSVPSSLLLLSAATSPCSPHRNGESISIASL